MKNKSLAIVVIMFTLVSVAVMFYYSDEEFDYKKSLSFTWRPRVLKSISISNFSSAISSFKFTMLGNSRKKDLDEVRAIIENNSNDSKKEVEEKAKMKNTTVVESVIKSAEIIKLPLESSNGKSTMESVSVFKASLSSIENNISLEEKIKLSSIVNKISPIDYARINNYLKEEDKNEAVKKIFALLKMRLAVNEYEEIKNSVSQNIDFDILEKEIARIRNWSTK